MVLAVCWRRTGLRAGGMLHVINHVFFKDLLFLVCAALSCLPPTEKPLMTLAVLAARCPLPLPYPLIAGLFRKAGVPPTSGFSSKWLIYHVSMEAGQPFLGLLSLIGSVLTMA